MKKLLKVFNSLEEIIAGSLFGVMCITILCQMFSRIFLKKALLFSEEISRFCYAAFIHADPAFPEWVVFLCISLGEKKFEHFNVEVFLSFVKGVPNQLLRALTSLFCFGIHLYLLYWSVQFFDFQKVVKSAAMEIPMAVVAAGMVLGFFLGSVRCLVNAVNSVRKIGDMKGKEE